MAKQFNHYAGGSLPIALQEAMNLGPFRKPGETLSPERIARAIAGTAGLPVRRQFQRSPEDLPDTQPVDIPIPEEFDDARKDDFFKRGIDSTLSVVNPSRVQLPVGF
jgi:hypothetical protein